MSDVDSNSESGEAWAPEVLKHWGDLAATRNMPGREKRYVAFLRCAFKLYRLPVQANLVWKSNKGWKYSHLSLCYRGSTRTMAAMEDQHAEIREIATVFPPEEFGIDWAWGGIAYDTSAVWEKCEWNGREYFHDISCIGKGDVPYLPPDIRAHIQCF